jgi:3-mercaptopyruvate sulfurtransferase SseA
MATHPTQYAHPEALVETDWLEKHLNDEAIRIVESNEDILLYDAGHILGRLAQATSTILSIELTSRELSRR